MGNEQKSKKKSDQGAEAAIEGAKRIRELRSFLCLSQAAFASPVGLSPTHIARYEKGVTPLSPAVIDRICKVYRVDPGYFTGELSAEEAVTRDDSADSAGKRLKAEREARGWTQHELAGFSGVDSSVISRVESGGRLTRKQGIKLAEALEVGVEWLLNADEGKRAFPVDQRMTNWLWQNQTVREEIWKRMKEDGSR